MVDKRITFEDFITLKKRVYDLERKLSDFTEMKRAESKGETEQNAEGITNTEVALAEVFEMILGG